MIFGMIIKAENHGPDLLVWVELRGFEPLTLDANEGSVSGRAAPPTGPRQMFTVTLPGCDVRHIWWTRHAAERRQNLRSTCGQKILRPPRQTGKVASDLDLLGRDGRI